METKETIYNLDQLVTIEVCDKKEVWWLKYQPFKKNRFSKDQKEGFKVSFIYDTSCPVYTAQEIRDGKGGFPSIVVDNKAYQRPYVRLLFSNEDGTIRYFDTLEEASKWAHEVADKGIKSKLIVNGEEFKVETN